MRHSSLSSCFSRLFCVKFVLMGGSLQTPREIMSQDKGETVQWVLDSLVGGSLHKSNHYSVHLKMLSHWMSTIMGNFLKLKTKKMKE